MKAYIVVDITVHDPEIFRQYVEKVPGFIDKHHGKYLVRGGECERFEGDWEPHRMVVLEFPSREHAMAFLQDPDYQPIAAIRQASAHSNLVVVDGYQ